MNNHKKVKVYFSVLCCLEMVSGEFLKGYLSGANGRVKGFGSSEGVFECSSIVWRSKCFIVSAI